ncbi:MAG: Smr/MutS family protein [Thermoanaerobaculaceae bacterium]
MDDLSEPHVLPIEDSLDLHTFAPEDLLPAVEAYLEEARRLGLLQVRLIHGKGKGVAKARVAALLARLPYVARAYEAPPDHGGWGATVVELQPLELAAKPAGINQDQGP